MTYDYIETVAREIGGGIWFVTSFVLMLALIAYIVRERGRLDDTTAVAFFLALICGGSAMRGLLLWLRAMWELNVWGADLFWARTWSVFATSVFLNAAGSIGCIWLLTPERWRKPLTIATVIVAPVLPVVTFFLF